MLPPYLFLFPKSPPDRNVIRTSHRIKKQYEEWVDNGPICYSREHSCHRASFQDPARLASDDSRLRHADVPAARRHQHYSVKYRFKSLSGNDILLVFLSYFLVCRRCCLLFRFSALLFLLCLFSLSLFIYFSSLVCLPILWKLCMQ